MLTDTVCRNAKGRDKIYALTDEKGLCIEVYPNGGRFWRLYYRHAGKKKRMALGVYPEVSLKDARDKRDELRKIIKAGEDPAEIRKKDKLEAREALQNTFKNIALEWLEKKRSSVTEGQIFEITRRLEMNVLPFLGSIPIKRISPRDLLATIRKVEERGALEMAHRTLQYVGQIFRYAIANGRAEHDITADLRGALIPPKVNHYAYFAEKEFCEFLGGFHEFRGNVLTKLALELLILTFVRSGELRGAKWEEFDFDKRQWRIPAERMKMKEQHIVPLSEQTVVVLEKIRKFSPDEGLLFPCRTDTSKSISDNTLSKAFRDQGYRGKATPHGIRATASTILNENGFKPDVIERQLTHCERNKIRASYNHAQYLPERKEMMLWWGEYVGKHMEDNV
ncbi:MAG: tyrosine-type recombinase/integrase [Holosporales bacterium]|jgi:integrase|nr:tyrosine-type recombinase/integrase [Holosporales bacterium]